jgi:LysR family transcriptional regulator, glycine cleavage system transcriptional activator
MLPSLESLHCFAEAARLLNFRAAARAVALTPAALGQRIRQLEDQLGAPLFHRTTRKVVLTQAGLALVPYAQRTLESAADCVRAGRGEVGPPPLDLTLGTRHELGMSWLVPLLPALRATQTGLTVHLYFGSSADLTLRVRNLEIDCAIGSMRLGDPRLDSIRLHREDYRFVGSPRLLKKRPLRRDADAADHTLIDSSPSMSLFGYFRSAPGGGDRLRFGRVLGMGTIAAIRALVLEGEGVGVLPAYLVEPDLRAGRLTAIFPSVKLVSDWFRLIFRSDDPRRSLYESLAQTLLAEPLK